MSLVSHLLTAICKTAQSDKVFRVDLGVLQLQPVQLLSMLQSGDVLQLNHGLHSSWLAMSRLGRLLLQVFRALRLCKASVCRSSACMAGTGCQCI